MGRLPLDTSASVSAQAAWKMAATGRWEAMMPVPGPTARDRWLPRTVVFRHPRDQREREYEHAGGGSIEPGLRHPGIGGRCQ